MRKLADIISTLIIFASISILIIWFWSDQKQQIVGNALVLDGDTILITNEKIRLEGIDAPEMEQECKNERGAYKCGISAKKFLSKLVHGQRVECSSYQRDKFERLLGTCIAGGTNLNAQMVKNGWAVSFGDYQSEEAQAENFNKGMWAGEFERPSTWRARQKNY